MELGISGIELPMLLLLFPPGDRRRKTGTVPNSNRLVSATLPFFNVSNINMYRQSIISSIKKEKLPKVYKATCPLLTTSKSKAELRKTNSTSIHSITSHFLKTLEVNFRQEKTEICYK